jgi:hypothetical protein
LQYHPDSRITFKVGAGGIGIVPTSDNETAPSGENTWFIDASTVNAPGGQGGKGRISSATTVLSGAGGVYMAQALWEQLNTMAETVEQQQDNMSGSGGSSGGTESDGINGGAVNTHL